MNIASFNRFATRDDYGRYLNVVKLFEKLISLNKEGYRFFVDGEEWSEPFIDGIELGFQDFNCHLLFCGDVTDEEGDYAIVDITPAEIVERITVVKSVDNNKLLWDI